MSHIRAAVPFDPGQDAWHAPTQCVHAAGYVTALIACVLACGWLVPEDLAEMWNWLEAGHWPSGFANEPGDLLAGRSGRQLVFPRRLLVVVMLRQAAQPDTVTYGAKLSVGSHAALGPG